MAVVRSVQMSQALSLAASRPVPFEDQGQRGDIMNETEMRRKIEQDAEEAQKREREEQAKVAEKEKKEYRRWIVNEVRAWITLGVALAALTVSIVALFI